MIWLWPVPPGAFGIAILVARDLKSYGIQRRLAELIIDHQLLKLMGWEKSTNETGKLKETV